MNGTLTFLGTGTSMGVPTIGCPCSVCTSSNPRDRRLRPSVMIRWNEIQPESGVAPRHRAVVIDTGPDFREQALRTGLAHVDAVFYTHGHVDHILGLDDLRPLSFIAHRAGGLIPLYASPHTAEILERVYDYTFSPNATYATRARVEIRPLADRTTIHGVEFLRIPVLHGDMEVAGFRFGNAAYLTDVSEIPESSFELLEGVETLVLPALRHKPHPSHATVAQAVGWAERIGARQTFLTHIAHELGHDETNSMLPESVRMAWDGLELPVTLRRAGEAA
ncbi:MBL fold metallo-hydrolase [Occallatibacter riparius]|uniref:MBL fold metallo-hydrolase n=1 Tax=Occallatibacter riparius TaxID=1002689 RepID=A0A9J7BQS1_9BACT|nr:MBL fold metallo-hydrolase [Occallatibacter riparius]UWZ84927.1 MBL fold metallo-hydrolase [Occallatibacter riparius]